MGKHSLIPVTSWCLAKMALIALVLMADTVISQSNNTNNNTLIRRYCSQYGVSDYVFFLRNLNSTFSSLRRQLANASVYHAVARTIINGESVYGLSLCREYLSNTKCLKCFDNAVKGVRVCGIVNGGRVIYDDCDLRYENYNFFTETNIRGNVGVCGNQTSSATTFRETVTKLLSDLRVATPKTSNFYAASMQHTAGSNVRVYAIAQCNINISQSDCAECLSIRTATVSNCLPNTSGRAIDAGCFMRYSATSFFRDNQTTDLTPFLKDDMSTGATELLQGPMAYSHHDLVTATNNFSKEYKLGEGSFGEVFKGTLNNGEVVAIKKTTMASAGRKAYFDNELKIISNVHHRHLLRLLGFCNKGPHLFLVLEFMENGSLDKFLYGDKRGSLTWKQRFEIIFGVARGLVYLHEQYHVTLVHRDIKSSNILLDNEFQPKISDFGLVRLLPEDKTHISSKVAGTFGFVAPEYAIHGQVSEKVDTYSFGVVVLEIISGRKCTDDIENGYVTPSLVDYAWNLYENGTLTNLIDITLDASEYVQEDVNKIIELSLKCTQSPASERPSMSEVVSVLSDYKSPKQISQMRSTFTTSDPLSASNGTTSNVELSGH